MTYVITSECERHGECAPICPTDSIHFVEGNSEWPYYYINPDTCIDCGACMMECPAEAIYPEDEVPAEFEEYIEINEAFFTEGPGQDLV
jgi:ferredoxin--NADP+ reductase